MKNLIRKLLQKTIEIRSTSIDEGCKVVFSIFNKDMGGIINEVCKFCEVSFLPIYEGKNALRSYLEYFEDKHFLIFDRLDRGNKGQHTAIQTARRWKYWPKIVYLDHGETGFSDPIGQIHWLQFADYYYANNTETKGYIKDLVKQFKSPVIVKERRRPVFIKRKISSTPFLLFAPSFYNGDLLIGKYFDTMKYKHRRHLVNLFNQITITTGIRIVWSGLKSGNSVLDPIIQMKKDGLLRFEYVEGKFNKLLSTCSCFLTDSVSTPFYDAVDLKIPSLCLYWNGCSPLREGVLHQFKNSIFHFNDVEEVDCIVDLFIQCPENFNNGKVFHAAVPDKYPWEI